MIILSSAKIKQSIQEQLINKYSDATFIFCESMQEAEQHIDKAEILLTYGEDVKDAHIEKASNLRWIMVISAGIDKLPFKILREKNIQVTNVRGIHAIPMAEYVIAMILQVSRNTKTLISHEQQKVWDRTVKMNEITGKTMIVVGAGAIGQEIARLGKAFSMKTIGINTNGNPRPNFDETYAVTNMKEVLREADFIVNVLPSTRNTEKLFDYDLFATMNESAIFINIGRGTTVNEADLIKVMQENKLSHAVLDVFEDEPLKNDHPFWTMENVTVTPHLSGISKHYHPRAFEIFQFNFNHYLNNSGPMKNVVDLERGY